MIFDRLENAERYYGQNPRFRAAFAYLKGLGAEPPEPGHFEIDGERVYAVAQRYETQMEERLLWECHRHYIDIQYVAQGEERIGAAVPGTMELESQYDAGRDSSVSNGVQGAWSLPVREGEFAVFFPGEPHRPRCAGRKVGDVVKLVVKVLV